LNLELGVRRYAFFARGVTPEAVGEYLKRLRQERRRFDDAEFALPRPFRLNDEARSRILSLLDDEIRLGEFFFELRGRQKEPGFDTWIFTPQEERQPRYGWATPEGELWTRSNGGVMAEIEIDRTRVMTRVSLRLAIDSDMLTFYEPTTGREVSHRFLRNETSIQAEVERLKKHAKDVMQEHLLPRREARDQALFRELLGLA